MLFLGNNMLALSNDGYIRMTLLQLQGIPLQHLLSGLDEDCSATIAGYTEWLSEGQPAITLGWDWCMVGHAKLQRVDEPRSNLMLVDEAGCDLGYDATLVLLGKFVDGMEWQKTTLSALEERYSG